MTKTRPTVEDAIDALGAATDALIDTALTLTDEDLAAPSLLPGWTRAHVLAHVALNAKGLAGMLTFAGTDTPIPMYASNERRDADIDELAAEPRQRLVDRLITGCSLLGARLGLETAAAPHGAEEVEAGRGAGGVGGAAGAGAAVGAAGDAESTPQRAALVGTFERVPGAEPMPVAEVPYMRWREVAIHHADLGVGYSHRQWSDAFTGYLLDLVATDRAPELSATVHFTDPGAEGEMVIGASGVGEGSGAVGLANGDVIPGADGAAAPGGVDDSSKHYDIEGSRADVTWWLIGRGSGEGLTGELPELGPWVRRR